MTIYIGPYRWGVSTYRCTFWGEPRARRVFHLGRLHVGLNISR